MADDLIPEIQPTPTDSLDLISGPSPDSPEPIEPADQPAPLALVSKKRGRRKGQKVAPYFHKGIAAKEALEAPLKRHYAKPGNDPLDRLVARRRATAILALKLEGRRPMEIAEELNVPVKTVYWALYQLRRGGHLKAQEEVADAIKVRIKPLIVERLEERLENPLVDQDLLIEAAKGTGIFVSHQKIKNDGPVQQQALLVKFELPEGVTAPIALGEIHGTPIQDAEVIVSE